MFDKLMRTAIRLLLCAASWPAFAADVDWPSPDGKLAFLASYDQDLKSIDLIDQKSGEKLQRIGEDDSTQTYWHVLWAPDSKRFALMTRRGHPLQDVDVYYRSGETFRQIELPDLPSADIPQRLKHGKSFPHVAALDWGQAEKWMRDGSLVVTVESMIDGGGAGSISAKRTVVLGFDGAGKARIVKSTIKYESQKD